MLAEPSSASAYSVTFGIPQETLQLVAIWATSAGATSRAIQFSAVNEKGRPVRAQDEGVDEKDRQRVGKTELGKEGVRRYCAVRNDGGLPAQTFTTIFSFGETGSTPNAGLVQGIDGDFYGTTVDGGNGGGCLFPNIGCRTLFKITLGGTLTTHYSFCSQSGCPDGGYPYAALVQATNGDFYGTTVTGCNAGEGISTIFKITPHGTLTTLYSFGDGESPTSQSGALVQATNGGLYGTTAGPGTVFKVTANGKLTTIYTVETYPNPAGALVQAANGNLYGVTSRGREEWRRDGLQDYPKRPADDAIQLLFSQRERVHGRRGPLRGANPGHRW